MSQFGLTEGERIKGPRGTITFRGVGKYATTRSKFEGLRGEPILVFESDRARLVQLFPAVIKITRDFLRTAKGDEELNTKNFRAALKSKLYPKKSSQRYPGLTGVDSDYINVARFLIHRGKKAPIKGGVIAREILARQGQGAFRRAVFANCKGRCIVSGSAVSPTLEAAHIVPFAKKKGHSVGNGILLRADLHTLFDLGLLRLEPIGEANSACVHVDSVVAKSPTYKRYEGKIVTVPAEVIPSLKDLWKSLR